MIRVIPTIQSLEPSEPIKILVRNGSATGISDIYEMTIAVQLNPIDNYTCTARLSIDNPGSYLFEDGKETKEFPFHASQNGDEVILSFRIKNKKVSFPKLLLSVRTNADNDPQTKRVDNTKYDTELVAIESEEATNA